MRNPRTFLSARLAGWVLAFLHLTAAPLGTASGAAPSPNGTDAKVEKDAQQQAKAWAAFYDHKYDESIQLADPLTKLSEAVRVEAFHCQARCQWAMGTADSRGKAKQVWAALEKQSTLNSLLRRLKIAKALELASDKKNADAVKVLEPLLQDPFADTCTAEAAIELGQLYTQLQRIDDARRAYRFAEDYLKRQVRKELPEAIVEPFLRVARKFREGLDRADDIGREPFEKAEALRKAGKLSEAIQAYEDVRGAFPRTDYALRSEVQVGFCLAGLKKHQQAIDRWGRFVASGSSGPWRGQAYIALIELFLDDLFALDAAAKYADQAEAALQVARKDPALAESWGKVARDILFYKGLAAYFQGKGVSAGDAFEQAARQAGTAPDAASFLKGVRLLSACSGNDRPALPKEVGQDLSTDRRALALAIGTAYRAVGWADRANPLFDRVIANEGKSATAAQLSYAAAQRALGAMCAPGGKNREAAKAGLVNAMKAYPKGSWHEATLYGLATLAQDDAERTYGPAAAAGEKAALRAKVEKDAAEKAAKEGKDPKAAVALAVNAWETAQIRARKSLTKEDRDRQEKEEKARIGEFVKGRVEALAYWRELAARSANRTAGQDGVSPYLEAASYFVAADMEESSRSADASAKGAAAVKEASTALSSFITAFPQSLRTGEVYARRIDLALECELDLAAAKKISEAAQDWAEAAGKKRLEAARLIWNPWEIRPPEPDAKAVQAAVRDVYLRSGVVAYLSGDYDRAVKLCRMAANAGQSARPEGISSLIDLAMSRKRITPEEALRGDEKVSLVLQLADAYFVVGNSKKAMELLNKVLGTDNWGDKQQRSWAAYRRGRVLFMGEWMDADPLGAQADYLLAVRQDPKSPWAYDALFLAANIEFNVNRNYSKAIDLWRRVVAEYPQSAEAPRSAYFIGVAMEQQKKPREAREAYLDYIRRYPESPFIRLADYHLKSMNEKATTQKN